MTLQTTVVQWVTRYGLRAVRAVALGLAVGLVGLSGGEAAGQDVSAPPILQIFDTEWGTLEERMVDIHMAGYGAMWLPPPARADSGNQSVGFDVFDRFDLGSPGNPTLYGTETGLKALVDSAHQAGLNVHTDFIINHNGFRDASTPGFLEAGGFPGFVLQNPDGDGDPFGVPGTDGDFHGRFEEGDIRGRLSGLIDINHATDHQLIRHPVDPNDPRNIPAGSFHNQPDPNNARFFPDRDLGGRTVFDPRLNREVTLFDFNTENPMAGDAVPENAMGLLMRNARWMIQEVGVDGFRVDAAKHVHPWVMDFFDQAVFDAIAETNLDGSAKQAFSFSEVLDGDSTFIQQFVRKDIGDPNVVGGNRDALDFPLFFAMRDNLTANGQANDWRNIKNASFAAHDDGLANNGSQGVAFVRSHDDFGPHLGNVAHAFTLMRPGNTIVYMDGQQFGDRDFPKAGRGDALGGQFGDTITNLVSIRNTHGRGNFLDRTPGGDEKEMLIFERENSSLVVLSNRLDGGFDSRTIQTAFAPGTPLIELTGNAADPTVDPFNDFPELVVVKEDGTVDLRVPRNRAPGADGVEHGKGFFIFGPSGPQGEVTLSNVAFTLEGNGDAPTEGIGSNATTRVHDIEVVQDDTFEVKLETQAVNLLGSFRDRDADGDNALLKLNDGMDVNGNGVVDHTEAGSTAYGFENFTEVHQPGFFQDDGNGLFIETIDTTGLEEGVHFLTVRAFRKREAGEPAIFTDFRKAVLVDRLPPESDVVSFQPFGDDPADRDLIVESVDQTADNMHVFLNLPAGLSDEAIRDMVGQANEAGRIDRDQWAFGFFDVGSGNHAATVVTFERTGRFNVQRFTGLTADTGIGRGLGDLDFDQRFSETDLDLMMDAVVSDDAIFNPAGDFTADGRIDVADWDAFGDQLLALHGDGASDGGNMLVDDDLLSAFLLTGRDLPGFVPGDLNRDGAVDGLDIDPFVALLTEGGLRSAADLNGDGAIDGLDIDPFVNMLTGAAGVTASDLAAIPEPATGMLLLIGAAGVVARRGCSAG